MGLAADPGPEEDRMRRPPDSPDSPNPADPPKLPYLPDLDQLRHQARDLQRAAARGEADAARRLRAVSASVTLSAAQLALARAYGFTSWTRLKAEVERRAARTPEQRLAACLIRPVGSEAELAAAFDVIGAQITPKTTHDDRRFRDLARRIAEDRPLMLVVEDEGQLLGGALAFRPGGRGVTLRAIGLDPRVRGLGIGRRLMTRIELEAVRLGAGEISLGADARTKGFYARLGYAGRGVMMHKGLPLRGRFLEARLRKLRDAAAGISDGASA